MKELFSKNLKFLRKKSGKNQTELGLELEKSHTTIGNWEKGIAEPSMDEIMAIARIFEISAQDLLFKDLSATESVVAEPGEEYNPNRPADLQNLKNAVDALIDEMAKNSKEKAEKIRKKLRGE